MTEVDWKEVRITPDDLREMPVEWSLFPEIYIANLLSKRGIRMTRRIVLTGTPDDLEPPWEAWRDVTTGDFVVKQGPDDRS